MQGFEQSSLKAIIVAGGSEKHDLGVWLYDGMLVG